MNFDLKDRTIFLTLAGSRAYGFANPDSDYDYRGVAIPPLDSYIGVMGKWEHSVDDKTKHVWTHYKGIVEDEADMQVYELCKFIRLAAECNPSIIEVLFTDPSTHLICHPVMNKLLENKHLFLSKQAKARFCGYAVSQLNRIKRHKRWLDNPPTHKPERSEFGLPEHKPIPLDQIGAAQSMIQKRLDEFMIEMTDLPEHLRIEVKTGVTKMVKGIWLAINPEISYPVDALDAQAKWESHDDAMKDLISRYEGYSENFLAILSCEKRYQSAKREWDQYQTWLKNRNPDRASLEAKFGYDTKHAAHLVRLIRMAREILETGEVKVLRPDAEEIREIRKGKWTYEQIVEFADKEDENLIEVAKNSKLPRNPDIHAIHELTYEMVYEFNTKYTKKATSF